MPSLTAEQEAQWSESRRSTILGVCVLMLVLGNLSVPMRIWGQKRLGNGMLLEDYFLILGLLFANVVTGSMFVALHYGFGFHLWRVTAMDPTMHSLRGIFFCIWMTAVFNGPCLIFVKLGLLFFYRRLFLINQRWLHVAWWINLVYVVLWAVGSTFFYIFQCLPAQYYWERVNLYSDIKNGICKSAVSTVAIPLIFSVISDFMILLMPLATVSTLQMPLSRKLGVMAIFGVGIAALACGLLRIIVLEFDTELNLDPTYGAVSFELLNVVELNLGILCACLVPIAMWLRAAKTIAASRMDTSPSRPYEMMDMERSGASNQLRAYRPSRLGASSSTEHFVEETMNEEELPRQVVLGWDRKASSRIVVKKDVEVTVTDGDA